MNEELRKKNLQQLDDASAIWQALKEVLDEATEMSVASAISDGVETDDRHWRAGYAQAVQDVHGDRGNGIRKVSSVWITPEALKYFSRLAAVYGEED